ncbi:MAG: enoyl-CoA hydratase/isomerase family protein [Leptospiraceae bacterium]|nr:enoyl-CoA hydratase/isomerase family protein [Leptospiraceae bacterium]
MKSIEFSADETIKAGVIRLSINDQNSFDTNSLQELGRAIASAKVAAESGAIKSLVIESERTGVFSQGMNLAELSGEGLSGLLQSFYANLEDLYYFPLPVIAKVSGHAIGYGCMLALMADYRIVTAASARIGLPEVKIAMRIPSFVIREMQRITGYSYANRHVLEGNLMKPAEALQCGLADQTVPPEELDAAVRSICKKFQNASYFALKINKEAMRDERTEVRSILERDCARNEESIGHPHAAEGLASARESRRPVFR